jgi:hypothetical protein
VKAKAFLVAVNKQLDAAPLNSRALGKVVNEVNELDQLNIEIEKGACGKPAPCGGLSYAHAYSIATT